MIYLSEEELKEVEYLIEQSAQGNHVLFDPEKLRKALIGTSQFSEEDAYAAEPHIERIMALPSLPQKRAYLESLDDSVLENVIRTYLSIVENRLYEKIEVRH